MYIADLHIHSRYSRATSRECTPEHLDLWARRKGIQLLGTGDFTHPAWREELAQKLAPAEDGLYILKEEEKLGECAALGADTAPRFVISGEISSIYKKNGRVRKVHSLILLPGLSDAQRLSRKLETIGNIHSDGRPILGLDCRDLLEITMELCPGALFIPAHIWTPHFSMFGAFSGFDTVEECFEDMTPYIHAVETGLSSDPPMNWRLSALDRYQLVSNSDAHSPAKLGREANLLEGEISYESLSRAVTAGEGLAGTIEFFPEEGKYHYDGHRKCHLCLSPAQAEQYEGKCPVCGRKLTMGVSHRIEQLADREEGYRPLDAKPFESLVPLPEVIAASTGHSSASTKVQAQYFEALKKLGPEFYVLREAPLEDIRRAAGSLTAEGIRRIREGKVSLSPGFDGEYGTVKLFEPSEIDNLEGQMSLFMDGGLENCQAASDRQPQGYIGKTKDTADRVEEISGQLDKGSKAGGPAEQQAWQEQGRLAGTGTPELNKEQQDAVEAAARAIAVIAGPGTGKTKTLVSRTLHLLQNRKVPASEITAVTFTKKAAGEMQDRLAAALGGRRSVNRLQIGTFHSICNGFLKEQGVAFELADELDAQEMAKETIAAFNLKLTPRKFLNEVSRIKSAADSEYSVSGEALQYYQALLKEQGVLDFDDLLLETIRILQEEKDNKKVRQHYAYLLIDEYQDISPIQYELIREWNRFGKELFAIGDPDQSIYGFRGSDARCFGSLERDFPNLLKIRLKMNYRSAAPIVRGALAVISKNPGGERELVPASGKTERPVRLVKASGEMAEAIFTAKEINRMIGGIDMLDTQSHMENEKSDSRPVKGFADIAVLYRTHRQAELLEKCLQREGIPYIVTGRDEFLDDEAVRGCVSFFRHLMKPEDFHSKLLALKLLWHLPENQITDCIFTDLEEKYRPLLKRGKPVKILEAWAKDMEMEEKQSMIRLMQMAVFYKNMQEFLEDLSFAGEGELRRCQGRHYDSDSVSLMTLHGSKGLEFPAVIMCGVRKGMIPMENEKQPADEEEERRLFYVGMTRAKEELILVTSQEPSKFLEDIPEECLSREDAHKEKEKSNARQLSLFDFITEDE